MTFLQIEYFLTVAKCLNMSEAAKRLYMTQPTLSRQITAVETELNFPLFYRGKKGLQLTPAGRRLAQRFETILADYRDAVQQARADNPGVSGTLNIGVLDGHMVGDFFPRLLGRFREEHPELMINTQRRSFAALAEGLYDRTLDLAVTMSFDAERRPGLEFCPLERAKNYLVVPAGHPKAALPHPRLSDFRDEVFIVNAPDDCEVARQNILESCGAEGFQPRLKFAPTLEQYMLWVEAGYGVSVLSEKNILSQNPTLRFLDVPHLMDSDIVLAWNQEIRSPAVSVGIQLTRRLLEEAGGTVLEGK